MPTPPSLPSQTHSPEHQSTHIPCPLGHPSSGQRPPIMPSTSLVTCKASDTCWRLCYFFLGLSQLHYKVRRKINVPQGTSQLTSALGLQYMFPGLQLVELREPLALPSRELQVLGLSAGQKTHAFPPRTASHQGHFRTQQ